MHMRTMDVRPIHAELCSSDPTTQRTEPASARAYWTRRRRGMARLLSTLLLLLLVPSMVHANPVAPLGCSAAAGTCVRIGLWLCPNPVTCSSLPGHDRMVAWYKERVATLLHNRWHGVPIYWIELITEGFFVSTPAEIARKINDSFIGEAAWAGGTPLVDYTILPFGSLWDKGMPLLERWRIPSVGALSPDSRLFQCAANATIWRTQEGCTAPNTRRFQFAHSSPNPGEQYFEAWVGMLKRQKATSIALVRTIVPFYLGVRDGIVSAAGDNHIAISYDTVALLTGSPAALQPETVNRIIAEIQALPAEPDGVAFLTQDCVPWIRALRAANFAPKSVAAILCSDSSAPLVQLGSDLNYIVGSSQWAAGLTGADYTENDESQPWSFFPAVRDGVVQALTSPLQFQATYRQIMNSTTIVPGYADAGVLAAFEFLEGAVSLAGSVDPVLVQAQLKSFYQPSFYGLLTTNRFGQNNAKQLVINQRDAQGILQTIAPAYAATADFAYPMPRWDERVYSKRMFASTIERVLLALLLACSVCTGLLMVWLWRNRNTLKWTAAPAGLWIVQGVGCLLAYAAVPAWPVENDAHTCHARVWLWTLAFHAFVDPLLASSYGIAHVARLRLEATKLSSRRLALGCAALLTPQLVINIVWASMAPLTPSVVTGDPLRPAHTSFTTCTTGDRVGFVSATLIYSAVLLLVGCALAYRVRSARIYSDAKTLTSTMYFFVTTAAVVLVVQVTLRNDDVNDQRVLFGLRSVGALITFQGSLAMLYLRRILDVRAAISGGRTQPSFRTSQVAMSRADAAVGEPAHARSPAAEATAAPHTPAAAAAIVGDGAPPPAGPGTAHPAPAATRSTRLTPPGHSPAGTLPPGGTVTLESGLVLPRHDLSNRHSSASETATQQPPPPPLPDHAELMALSTEECIELVHSYWSAIQAATSSLRRRQQMQLLSAAAEDEDGGDAGSSHGSFMQLLRSQAHPPPRHHLPRPSPPQTEFDSSPVRLHDRSSSSAACAAPLPPGATPSAHASGVAVTDTTTPEDDDEDDAAATAAAKQSEEIELVPYPDAAVARTVAPQQQQPQECKQPD